MAVNCLKAAEPLRRGTLLFTNKLPSISSFSKKSLPTIFQFTRIDSNSCGLVNDVKKQKSTSSARGIFIDIRRGISKEG